MKENIFFSRIFPLYKILVRQLIASTEEAHTISILYMIYREYMFVVKKPELRIRVLESGSGSDPLEKPGSIFFHPNFFLYIKLWSTNISDI